MFKTIPETLWTAFVWVLNFSVDTFVYIINCLADAVTWLWTEVIVPVADTLWSALVDYIVTPIWWVTEWTWENITKPSLIFVFRTLPAFVWEHITVPILEFVFKTVPEALINALIYILECMWDATVWLWWHVTVPLLNFIFYEVPYWGL